VVEVSAVQMKKNEDFHPKVVVFTDIGESYPQGQFKSVGEYLETKLSIVKRLSPDDILVVNFDRLANNTFFRNANCQVYWYSRRSFVQMGVVNEVQGTHFHDRRVHSNINYHSEFKVTKMRIIGQNNRENLLSATTVAKALDVSDKAIQKCIEKFPGIPHRLEFLMEKNGVSFYNDSKSETMEELLLTLESFKTPVILIAGGKDIEELEYERYSDNMVRSARVLVLVGESKERMNRAFGEHPQTYIVGSFEESVLFAYQKSRTGDTILLSPGNPATDFFRDFEERGNYYKKLVYQL
jgi:UDP-N-acetylmuramoylalanine--D-glutamate ligase